MASRQVAKICELLSVRRQLLGDRPLGRRVGHEAVQPRHQSVPGRQVGDVLGRLAHLLDLVDVHALEEVLAGGEVAVERADTHLGAAGDVFQRGRGAVSRQTRRRQP